MTGSNSFGRRAASAGFGGTAATPADDDVRPPSSPRDLSTPPARSLLEVGPGGEPASPADEGHLEAAVIGAGFSGLYMLYRLRDLVGLNVKVFESAPRVGGTWYWNRYPGARCDTESYIYCYSFSRDLYQEWEWSGRYPARAEILAYLEHVADRFDLNRDIMFDTEVTSVTWDEACGRWNLVTDGGRTFTATFVVTAIGILTAAPYQPDLPGLDTFEGQIYHTRTWPEDMPDLSNRIVAVMGTGSTGAQMIPSLAGAARELVVIQRTAQFMVPAHDSLVGRDELTQIKRNFDEVWEKARWSVGGLPWRNNGRSAWDDTAEQRRETWERLWEQGGQRFIGQNYKDVVTDPGVSEMVGDFVREKIRARVVNPRTAELLTPRSYHFGGRRVVIENSFYETFNLPNVTLIDVSDNPVVSAHATGLTLADGEQIPLDVLIFATGFDAVTGPFFRIDFQGRNGETLVRLWEHGPRSYLGMAVTGFPNMFMITGPGSTFGNHAVLMEHQVEWISGAIAEAVRRGAATVETAEQAQDEWTKWVDEAARSTVQFGTKSWHNGTNIPGKARGSYVYLGSYRKYRKICDDAAADGFTGLNFT